MGKVQKLLGSTKKEQQIHLKLLQRKRPKTAEVSSGLVSMQAQNG